MSAIKIKGMSCQHCVNSVTKALQEIKGMADVKVDLARGEATYSETSPVSANDIKEAIRKIGFEAVD